MQLTRLRLHRWHCRSSEPRAPTFVHRVPPSRRAPNPPGARRTLGCEHLHSRRLRSSGRSLTCWCCCVGGELAFFPFRLPAFKVTRHEKWSVARRMAPSHPYFSYSGFVFIFFRHTEKDRKEAVLRTRCSDRGDGDECALCPTWTRDQALRLPLPWKEPPSGTQGPCCQPHGCS